MTYTKPVRDSNLELLRIVAMMFIVLHHFIVHGYQLAKLNTPYFSLFPKQDMLNAGILLSANSFFIIGVNLFLLISGYYSIKLKWKSVINLALICLFYDYGLLSISSLISGSAFPVPWWEPLIYVFTRSGWFITCYFALMLLSPAINRVTEIFTTRERIYGLCILFLLNFWFGYYIDSMFINQSGYSLMQFIFMYYTGRMLYFYPRSTQLKKRYSLGIYVIITACISFFSIYYFYRKDYALMWKIYHYDNPLVVASAVLFFITFKNIRIRSSMINRVASSTLAIYLIHESPFLSKKIHSTIFDSIRTSGHFGTETICVLLWLFLIIMAGAVLVDKVRMLITDPIVLKAGNSIENILIKLNKNIFDRCNSINK